MKRDDFLLQPGDTVTELDLAVWQAHDEFLEDFPDQDKSGFAFSVGAIWGVRWALKDNPKRFEELTGISVSDG